MKTLNSVCLGVAVAVVIGFAFGTPARAGCGKKSKKMCMDMSAAKQDAVMTDDMPMYGMKMDDEGMKSERGGGEAPAMGSMGEGGMSGMADEKGQAGKQQVKKVEDPVCHMPVDPKLAEKSLYKGKTYYFCSKGDKEKFEQSPEKYLQQQQPKQ